LLSHTILFLTGFRPLDAITSLFSTDKFKSRSVIIYFNPYAAFYGPGSSAGIATELRAGRSGIDSRWEQDIPPVLTGPGAHPAVCKMGTGSFPGLKVRPERAADHSPPSSAAVMEE